MLSLNGAPEEVLYRIFDKLDLADKISAQLVSKRFASVLAPPSKLWRQLDIALTDSPQIFSWFAERASSVATLLLSEDYLYSVHHLRTSILAIAASHRNCHLTSLSIDNTGSESGVYPSACLQVHLTKLELLKVSFTDLNPRCITQLSRLQNLQSLHLERDAGEAVHGPPSLDQANALWQAIGSLRRLTSLRVCSLDLDEEESYDMGRRATPLVQLSNLRKLHLQNCRFEVLPSGFSRLPHLESLHLHEELTFFESLHDLTALTHLHLGVRSPFHLVLPKGLRSLSLAAKNDGSQSTHMMDMTLYQLLKNGAPSLSSLRLRRFNLTFVLSALVDRRLLKLDLRNNEFEGSLPPGDYLTHMQSLIINYTPITLVPAVLALCIRLRELEIGSLQPPQLTEQGLRTLLSLPSLRSLRVPLGVQEDCDHLAASGRYSQEEINRLRQLCDAGLSRASSAS